MSPLTPKQVVIEAWKAFSSREPARITEFFTADAEWLAPAGNATAMALNVASHMVGRDAIVQFIVEEFPKLFVSDVTVDIRGVFAEGQTVFLEERMTATLSNGQRYENDYCFAFVVSGERISRVREYMDTQRGARCVFGETTAA